MPTNICFDDNDSSANADFFLKWLSFISFGFNLIYIIFAIFKEKNRLWPKRTELYVILSVLLLQISWTMGPFTDFQQLEASSSNSQNSINNNENEGYGEIGSWQTKVCFSQGVLFQFSAFLLVFLFIWYQISRYLMLCKGLSSYHVADMEFCVIIIIIIVSLVFTILPILLHNVGSHRDLYACW